MAAIKIKSTDQASQGDFVLIEEEDFNPDLGHELYEPKAAKGKKADPVEPKAAE